MNYCITVCFQDGLTLTGDIYDAFSTDIVVTTQGMLVDGSCLKLDLSFHCVKTRNKSGQYKCMCNAQNLSGFSPAHKKLIMERQT